MKKGDKILNLILPILTVGCILLVWTVASLSVNNEYVLPSVVQTLNELFLLLGQAKFYIAFLFTLLRSVIAFLISFILASVLSFLAHKSKKAERVAFTITSILRALPTVAIVLPLLFLTRSNTQVTPVVVTMLVVMPTTYTHLKSALDSVDKSAVEASMVDGASKIQSFIKVELPQIAPAVYSAVGSGLSLNFKLMVAAEVLSATVKSLGNLLNVASFNGQIASMIAMVIVAVLFGLIIEAVFIKISKKVSDWR